MKRSMYVFVLLLCVAYSASSAPVILYNGVDYTLATISQNGWARSQQFNAIDSTPDNGLTGSETFTIAGIQAYVTDGETARLSLKLYLWDTDYATTLTGPVLAGPAVYDLTSTPTWYNVTSAVPLTTNATYMLLWDQSNISGPIGYFTYRSNANDGGPNNDAYHDGILLSNREYQIQLDGGSLPVDDWMLY